MWNQLTLLCIFNMKKITFYIDSMDLVHFEEEEKKKHVMDLLHLGSFNNKSWKIKIWI